MQLATGQWPAWGLATACPRPERTVAPPLGTPVSSGPTFFRHSGLRPSAFGASCGRPPSVPPLGEIPMSVARPLTLADVAAPQSNALTNTLLVVAASLVTAAAAQVEIRLPWTPVPITGQTFAVLLSGAVLGARRAFLAQVLYLAEGASGLPFFSGGAAGVAKL